MHGSFQSKSAIQNLYMNSNLQSQSTTSRSELILKSCVIFRWCALYKSRSATLQCILTILHESIFMPRHYVRHYIQTRRPISLVTLVPKSYEEKKPFSHYPYCPLFVLTFFKTSVDTYLEHSQKNLRPTCLDLQVDQVACPYLRYLVIDRLWCRNE